MTDEQNLSIVATLSIPTNVEADRYLHGRLQALNEVRIQPNGDSNNPLSYITKNGVLVDIGTGEGNYGALVAEVTGNKLVQADVIDHRRSSAIYGDLLRIPEASPPNFEGTPYAGIADTVFIADTLQEINYSGTSILESKLNFLKRASILLKPQGKIVVVSTNKLNNTTALEDVGLYDAVRQDAQLCDIVVGDFGPPRKVHIKLG